MLVLRWLCLIVAISQLAPAASRAACCQIVKVDPTSAFVVVRVCTPDASEGCAAVLFEGTLAQDESQSVCPADTTVVYQEQDPETGVYAALIGAVCEDDGDVEI